MKEQDFTTTILVDQTPGDVFNAIRNVRGWWSEEIDGSTSDLDDVFTYHYRDVHICRIKLIQVVPDKTIVWQVMDNYFSFTEDKHEWRNTKISFEISSKANRTELRFTHFGLGPDYECFEICKEGWTNYINGSLRNLINTGQGKPNPKEGGFNAALVEKWNFQH